jgi:predicted RND superfamily exporter protein
VIHIGVAYHEIAEELNRDGSEAATRTDCTRESVAQLGFPIISAAFTTLISAIILFFAQITFFNKFGLIVMLSMVIAVSVTFMLYVPLLDALGPNGHQGDVWRWIAKCRKAT